VQWSDLVKTGQESREFAALFLRGMRSFQDLDAPDKLSFSAFFTRYTRNCEGMFIYYRDGALEKALWDEVERTMMDYFAYPGVREWWATRKHWLTDEFRAVVEAIIVKNPEPKLYAAYNLDASPKASPNSVIRKNILSGANCCLPWCDCVFDLCRFTDQTKYGRTPAQRAQ